MEPATLCADGHPMGDASQSLAIGTMADRDVLRIDLGFICVFSVLACAIFRDSISRLMRTRPYLLAALSRLAGALAGLVLISIAAERCDDALGWDPGVRQNLGSCLGRWRWFRASGLLLHGEDDVCTCHRRTAECSYPLTWYGTISQHPGL